MNGRLTDKVCDNNLGDRMCAHPPGVQLQIQPPSLLFIVPDDNINARIRPCVLLVGGKVEV